MAKFHKIFSLFFIGVLIVAGVFFLSTTARADYESCVASCGTENSGSPAQIQECINGCVALYTDNTNQNQLPGVDNTNQGSASQGSVQLPNFLGPGVNSISDLILKIVNFLMALALPFAALMVVWAGFQFVTAQGSEEKLTKAKRNLVWTVLGVLVILAAKEIVGYITELLGGTGTSSLMTKINNLLTQFYAVLFILVTVYFFWGVVQFVRSSASGGKEMEEGKQHMIWGIVGMAVMLGAWGIVRILQSVIQ